MLERKASPFGLAFFRVLHGFAGNLGLTGGDRQGADIQRYAFDLKIPISDTAILLKKIESIVLFVEDIEAASAWYAELFQTDVNHENSRYAFIKVPGCLIGFHPLDPKCPGGAGGTTVYWEVADLTVAVRALELRGAVLYRGPITTSFGARAAMLVDPFGCTIGINESTPKSLSAIELTA